MKPFLPKSLRKVSFNTLFLRLRLAVITGTKRRQKNYVVKALNDD